MEDEDESNDILGLGLGTSTDDGSGALGMGAATADSAAGLAVLDMPEAREALATMAKSSASARQALMTARQKISGRHYNRALPWFALSSALSKPTRTGGIGEVFGNVSDALQGSTRERDTFQQQQDKELLGLDTQIAGLDSSTASAQLKLAELKAKLGVQQQLVPNDKVIGPDGKVRYRSRPQARGEEAWTPPGTKVDVNLSTDKSLGEHMAAGAAKQYNEQFDAALNAPTQVDRSRRVIKLLDEQPYTGMGADFKLNFGKAAKAFGFDYAGTDIANTEALASELANSTLGMIRASGLGGGSGFSNTDRDFVEKASQGKITIDATSLRRMAKLNIRAQQNVVKKWNGAYDRVAVKNQPMLDSIGYTKFPIPSEAGDAPPAAAVSEVDTNAAPPQGDEGESQNPDDDLPAVDRAPPQAEEALIRLAPTHPELVAEFRRKYQYLPRGVKQ